MQQEYKVSSQISRGDYLRLCVKYSSKVEYIYIIIVCLFASLFCGRGLSGILGMIGLLLLIGLCIKNCIKFMSQYKEQQIVYFSERGIRREGDAMPVHWTQLGKAKIDKGWLYFEHNMTRQFFIYNEALSKEEEHFLKKRLRGIRECD